MKMTTEQLKELIGQVVEEKISAQRQAEIGYSQVVAMARAAGAQGRFVGGDDREKGRGAAQLVRALAAGRGDVEKSARWAAKNIGEDAQVTKALEAATDAAGGFIVPPNYSQEIIELLYPQTVVRSSGARPWPMPNGTAEVPKLAGGVNAEYVGENQNITTDQPDFGVLNLAAKKLACIVPISNDLIRYSAPNADTIVRDDLASAMALREDKAFLRDDGTGQKPLGIRFQAGITTIAAPAGTTPSLQVIRSQTSLLMLALQNNNVRMIAPGWIMAPRVAQYLTDITDGNGNAVYEQQITNGTFRGFPLKTTTQLPTNLGAGTNETEIYFVDFADAIIGESSELIIDASGEAAYFDGSAVQAAFSRDQTVIRAIARHDFGLRHPKSAAVLTGVQWGA